ncbi:MAG TPA: MFS transporter, partial [Solirubrobacteraceae bacterium]|nr:MFS transporter [Solirubrobacteraceae bacterium]
MSGLLPVLLEAEAGPLVAGSLVAIEGLFALLLPPLVGPWSDRRGQRLPFIAVAALVSAAALGLMAVGGPLWLLALWIAVFQTGYFAYLTVYFAIYPDVVDPEEAGRAQGAQGAWRAVGLGAAFVAGPALLGLWRPAPFLLACAVVLVVTPIFGAKVAKRLREAHEREAATDSSSSSTGYRALRELVREHPSVGWFVGANALWETALSALRAFAVLFVVQGLGRKESFASMVLAVVVVGSIVAAPLSGWLADRIGRRRVIAVCVWVYGLGAIVPALTQSVAILPVVLLVALAAVALMTLPYALLMGLLPESAHGAGAALFGVSRGIGLLAGPLLAGLAILTLEPVFGGTNGYAALFLVVAAAVLATLPLLRKMKPAEGAAATV